MTKAQREFLANTVRLYEQFLQMPVSERDFEAGQTLKTLYTQVTYKARNEVRAEIANAMRSSSINPQVHGVVTKTTK